MMRTICTLFLALLTTLDSVSATASPPLEEPPGLRDAIAAHINAQAAISRQRWHANIEDVDPQTLKFSFGVADLSGDGHEDAVVLFTGNQYCGSGGCTLEIYRRVGKGYKYVSGTTLAYAPIRASSARDKYGWRSLIVATRYWGDVALRLNGSRFPSLSNTHPRATVEEIRSSILLIAR